MNQQSTQLIVSFNFNFLVADESDVRYNYSTTAANIRLEREEARSRFLVELLDKHNFEMRNVRLDIEGPKCEILGSIDLAAFKNDELFLIAQFLPKKPSLAEIALSREALWEKMKDVKAKIGVLAWAGKQEIFSLKSGKIDKIKAI